MMRIPRLIVALPLVLAILAGCSTLKSGSKASKPADSKEESDDKKKDEIKAFKDVIKDDFESDEGLFNVYKDDLTYYYEIPNDLLGDELLLVTRIAKTANNIGYGGMKSNTQTVRWERQGDKVLLRIVSYQNTANEDEPIYQAVRNSNLEPILMSFDIKAFNEDTTGVVIDVSKLFTTDVAPLGLQAGRRTAYKVRRLDSDRTYIESIKSYPKNIEVRHILTYDATAAPSNGSGNAITLLMNQSMIELPEVPMRPRECDDRVGLFSVSTTDYSSLEQKAETRCFITKWRLEPKDPAAYARGELVEPVKQIVYYIDPATPVKWRSYLKQGIEDWIPAFEAAGFSNAIRAADPPTEEEDPEFSPEDVRYSVIRYYASNVQNAFGPHVSDPRTGEIIESDIGWYHNIQRLLRNWYMIQTAAANPDSDQPVFEDDVMGQLLRFVSAHEVGHTLGFQHNMGSSSAVPVDSLRSKTYTDAHGTAPSIMDYARMNYVAQPGDGVAQFQPKIGEYDLWSTKWAYTWMDDVSEEEEKATLNDWVIERADNPYFWWGRSGRNDPRAQTEDLGDDAMKASNYGIANLKRILDQLLTWTSKDGDDYDELQELYGNITGQYRRYIGHVTMNVGGIHEHLKTHDQEGVVYTPVARDRQEAAMQWLDEQVFTTPEWLMDNDVIRRFQGVGTLQGIRSFQVGAVNNLLNPQRLARMMEIDLFHPEAYSTGEMLADLRGSIFRELSDNSAIDAFRRNLQRGYVERMEYLLNEEPTPIPAIFFQFGGYTAIDVSQSDIRAYVRGELETLKGQVSRAVTRTRDNMTTLHLRDLSARIDKALDADDD